MNDYTHKNLSLAVTVVYSLLIHALAIIAFLTIPLYSGESRQAGVYTVHLESPIGGPDVDVEHHPALTDEQRQAGGETAQMEEAADETKEPAAAAPKAEESASTPEAPKADREVEGPPSVEASQARAEVEQGESRGPEAKKSVRKPRMPRKKASEEGEDEAARERQPVVAENTGVAKEPVPMEERAEDSEPEPMPEERAPAVKPKEEAKEPEPAEAAPPEAAPRVAEESPRVEEPSRIPEKRAELETPEPMGPVNPPKEPPVAMEKTETEPPPLLEPEAETVDVKPAPEEERYQEEQPILAYEKPGWQEPPLVTKDAEEAGTVPGDKEEPPEPAPVPESQKIESPADMPLEAESATTLERPVIEEAVGAAGGTAEIERSDELCEDCGPIASLYENPVVEMVKQKPDLGMAGGAVVGTEGGMTSEKSVDMLCAGCLFLAMLEGNPTEEIIYEDRPQGRVPEGFLSPMEEFCRACRKPQVEAEVVKAVVWEISGDSAEVVGPPEAEDRKGLVLEVPEGVDSVAMDILRDTKAQKGIAMKVAAGGVAADTGKEGLGAEPSAEALDMAQVERPGDASGRGGVDEILTPRVNRVPSREDYIAALDEAFRAGEEPEEAELESPSLGLPLNIAKDIEIRVFFSGGGEGLSFRLLRGSHPMASKGRREAEDLTDRLEKLVITHGDGLRRILSLSIAGKGVYRFNIETSSEEGVMIDVEFTLYGGLQSERKKEYEGLHVAKKAPYEIKFIMPEAVFWDDEDYFAGEIEGPNSLTKFNDKTGLVWKEKTGR